MSDSVRVTNLPNAGSKEAVALDMWKLLRFDYGSQCNSVEEELKLYRRCLDATFNRPDNLG